MPDLLVAAIVSTEGAAENVLASAVKRRTKVVKVVEFPLHEHFGSPLNTCRVCGEKYTYTPKPRSPFPEK